MCLGDEGLKEGVGVDKMEVGREGEDSEVVGRWGEGQTHLWVFTSFCPSL